MRENRACSLALDFKALARTRGESRRCQISELRFYCNAFRFPGQTHCMNRLSRPEPRRCKPEFTERCGRWCAVLDPEGHEWSLGTCRREAAW